MAYFNDSDNFYSSSVAPEEFGLYPPLPRQTLATTEEVCGQVMHTFAGGWSTVDQPECSTIASTSLLAAPSHESTPSAFDSYLTSSYGSYWPTMNQSPDPDHSGTLNWDNAFASAQELETPMSIQTCNPVPAGSWGSQQYGESTNRSLENVTMDNPDRRRFTPYGAYHARQNMYQSAEAGPSNRQPHPASYDTSLTAQPPGWISETTANAEQNQTFTEEDGTPAPRTRRPPGQGVARPHRERNHKDVMKLRTWAKRARGSQELPSHQEAIAAAAEIITILRDPVYDEDRLFRGHGRHTRVGSERAEGEYERRNKTRRVYQTLSRYYPLEAGRSTWTTTQLLLRVLEDFDTIDDVLRNG